ncbi:MAG: DUF6456 domain-containing protein [Sphingopyxis sp.]
MPQYLVHRPHPEDDTIATPASGRCRQSSNAKSSRRTVAINVAENVVTWLHSRHLLTDRQALAGENLQRDFARAGLEPNVTMQWGAPSPDGSPRRSRSHDHQTLAHIDARRRFMGAMDHVGPGLADVCWRVICAGEGMSVAERSLGWPSRSGRIVLGLALDRLAGYYRVPG